ELSAPASTPRRAPSLEADWSVCLTKNTYANSITPKISASISGISSAASSTLTPRRPRRRTRTGWLSLLGMLMNQLRGERSLERRRRQRQERRGQERHGVWQALVDTRESCRVLARLLHADPAHVDHAEQQHAGVP